MPVCLFVCLPVWMYLKKRETRCFWTASFSGTSRVLVLTSSLLTKSCHLMLMILRWHLTWNASRCFASACRMVQVSEPHILASSNRMVTLSKPLDTLTWPRMLTSLINSRVLTSRWDASGMIWHHIRLRSLIAEAARPLRCIMSGL